MRGGLGNGGFLYVKVIFVVHGGRDESVDMFEGSGCLRKGTDGQVRCLWTSF